MKEKLVEIIMSQGYDMFTAGADADRVLDEFRKSDKQKQMFYCGKVGIELSKKPF